MSKYGRAVLRNAAGEHLMTLTDAEVESYEYLAECGEVQRFTHTKKGRLTLIFKLQPKPDVNLDEIPISPSDCSLSERDSMALAGCFDRPNRIQVERWIGWGLLRA